MADLDRIMQALKAADAAGDTVAATRLAQMAREAQENSQSVEPAAAAQEPGFWSSKADNDAPEWSKNYTGSLVPLSTNERGDVSFDSDAGIVGAVKRAVTMPRDVFRGDIDPTSPGGAQRTLETALTATPLAAAARAGGPLAPKSAYRQPPKPVPTQDALRAAASQSYKKVEDADVRFRGDAVEKMIANLERKLNEQGSFRTVKGIDDVYASLAELKGAPSNSYVQMQRLDSFRQGLSDLASSPKKQVRRAATTAIKELDDFIGSSDPARLANKATPGGQGLAPGGFDYAAADAAANQTLARDAAEEILNARGNYAAASRAEKIAELEDVMNLRASSANSGMNVDNTSRSKLVSLLINSGGKNVRGFSADEKQAIRDVIGGNKVKDALRRVGNMLGGGGGLGQTLITLGPAGAVAGSGGGLAASLAAMAPGAIGALSKASANKMARSDIRQLDEFIRMRSPLYRDTPNPMPVYQPGMVQGGAELGGKALAADQLPLYQPAPRHGPQMPQGMSQQMMRALLASPSGA